MEREYDKKLLMIIIFSAGIFTLLFTFFLFQRNAVKIIDIGQYETGNADQAKYSFSELYEEKGSWYISGYFFVKNREYTYYNYGMGHDVTGYYNNFSLLIADNGDKANYYQLPTKLYTADSLDDIGLEDNSEDADSIYSHGYCCFKAKIPDKYVDKLSNNSIYILDKDVDGNSTVYLCR